jgi:hypothetical protein
MEYRVIIVICSFSSSQNSGSKRPILTYLDRWIDRCLLWSPFAHLGDGDPFTYLGLLESPDIELWHAIVAKNIVEKGLLSDF